MLTTRQFYAFGVIECAFFFIRSGESLFMIYCVKTQFLMLKSLVGISQVGKVDSSTPARLPRWGPRPVPASSWSGIQLQITNSRSVTAKPGKFPDLTLFQRLSRCSR